MRQIQKYFCQTVCLFVCIFFLCGMQVQAGEDVVIQIGKAEGKKGDTITIPVKINNSKNVGGMDMTVVYDSKELYYLDAKKGNSVQQGNLCDINHQKGKSSIRFVYASIQPVEEDGDIMLLTFEVLENNRQGHTVDVDVKKILDVDIKELSWKVQGGREIAPTKEENKNTENKSSDSKEKAENENKNTENEKEKNNSPNVQSNQQKRRIVLKTKDGVKDVTDTIGKETNENLLPSEKKDRNLVPLVSVAVALIVGLGIWWMKRYKKSKQEEGNYESKN